MRAAAFGVAAGLAVAGTALIVADGPADGLPGAAALRGPGCAGAASPGGAVASVPGGAAESGRAPRRPGFRSAGGANGGRRQPAAARVPVERTVHLMGTWATLVVQAPDRASGLHLLERMVGLMERTEAALSTWRADSVLSALNRQPVDEPFSLPPALCGLWPRLARWHRLTGGAFDPAVGRLVEVWGLRTGGAAPAPDALRAARAATGFAHFRFEAETCRVTRAADAALDAGAFGKGEALRRLTAAAPAGLPWMVDFGGQIAVGGARADAGWPVALAHPAYRQRAAVALALPAGSLATSGARERPPSAGGRPRAHVLDPRSGRLVRRPASVTVWHEDPLAADVLSTALYVMGVDDGLEHAARHGVAAVFLVPDAAAGASGVAVRASPAFMTRFPAIAEPPPGEGEP